MTARILYRDAQGHDGVVDLLEEPVFVGRAMDCAIRTDDAMVSRKHSLVVMSDGRWWVEDLGSSNGTHVNDVKVKRQALAHNDVVRCGSLWLRFVDDTPPPPPPASPTVTLRSGPAQATVRPQMVQLPAEVVASDAELKVASLERELEAARRIIADQGVESRALREEVAARLRELGGELERIRAELAELLRRVGG